MTASDPLEITVRPFSNGATTGIFVGNQALHLRREEAVRLCGLLEAHGYSPIDAASSSGANSTQVGGDHYRKHAVQVWDAVVAWKLGFLDGNVVKYVVRFRDKGGVEDLQKARHYLDKLLETIPAAE
jgi:hypothetical protein